MRQRWSGAVAAQIIPTDDTHGARESRVIYFIDRALTTFHRDQQALYLWGLKDLQEKTQAMFPGAAEFSALAPEQQIQLLTAIENTDFFSMVRIHTVAGFLSNPEYGGNHDKIGWKLIGPAGADLCFQACAKSAAPSEAGLYLILSWLCTIVPSMSFLQLFSLAFPQ